MKKILLTSALIAGLTASVSAQGIEPVSTMPELDVTVGTQDDGDRTALLILSAVVIGGIIIASGDESDGTN